MGKIQGIIKEMRKPWIWWHRTA